jgi:hypothetical protein
MEFRKFGGSDLQVPRTQLPHGARPQSLRQRTAPPVPGLDGLRELQVEAALRRSIRERRPVNLAREFPL